MLRVPGLGTTADAHRSGLPTEHHGTVTVRHRIPVHALRAQGGAIQIPTRVLRAGRFKFLLAMTADPADVSHLVQRWSAGDPEALDQLVPVVYDHLRQLAHGRLRRELGERTLNTTGLVHEAYLRLVDSPDATLRNRSQFLALASHVMRNLLVDRARERKALKRGGGVEALPLEDGLWMRVDLDAFAQLDEALRRLEVLDPRQSRMLEQRYFGGLSLEETAAAGQVSLATVKRELRSARAWLANELQAMNNA